MRRARAKSGWFGVGRRVVWRGETGGLAWGDGWFGVGRRVVWGGETGGLGRGNGGFGVGKRGVWGESPQASRILLREICFQRIAFDGRPGTTDAALQPVITRCTWSVDRDYTGQIAVEGLRGLNALSSHRKHVSRDASLSHTSECTCLQLPNRRKPDNRRNCVPTLRPSSGAIFAFNRVTSCSVRVLSFRSRELVGNGRQE